MVAVPAGNLRDFLLAHWAASVLLFPEMNKPTFSFEGIYDMNIEAFFVVRFPFRIVGVGFCFDFGMSFDWHAGSLSQQVLLAIHFCIENPVVALNGLEVFLRDP